MGVNMANKFKVGDIIVANSNYYGITNRAGKCLMRVSEVASDTRIRGIVIHHTNRYNLFHDYGVLSCYFDLLSEDSFFLR